MKRFLLTILAALTGLSYDCIHDQIIKNNTVTLNSPNTTTEASDTARRILVSSTIRIRYDFAKVDTLKNETLKLRIK
jgi:hypothetical protein